MSKKLFKANEDVNGNTLMFPEDQVDTNVVFEDLDFQEQPEDEDYDIQDTLEIGTDAMSSLTESIADSTAVLEDLYELDLEVAKPDSDLSNLNEALESLMLKVGYKDKGLATESFSNGVDKVRTRISIMWRAIINAIQNAINWIKNWFINFFRNKEVNALKAEIRSLISNADKIDFSKVENLSDPVNYPQGVQYLLTKTGNKSFDAGIVDNTLDELIKFVFTPPGSSSVTSKVKEASDKDTTIIVVPLPFANSYIHINKNSEDKFKAFIDKEIDYNLINSINDSKSMTRMKLTKNSYLIKLNNLDKLLNKVKEYNANASRLAGKLNSRAKDIERKFEGHVDSAEAKLIRDEINFNIQILTSLYPKLASYTVSISRAYLSFIKCNLR